MDLVDTHCHIQEAPFSDQHDATRKLWTKAGNPLPDDLIARAKEQGVTRFVVVGCSFQDSERAVALARGREDMRASIGIHPHEASVHLEKPELLDGFAKLAADPAVHAIGECGLDYYYEHSPREDQIKILRFQLDLAVKYNLPVIFHVRDAFADFWPIFDEYEGIRGIIHSFTASQKELDQILARGLHVGLNGIMTFTKSEEQLAAARAVPLEKLVLETDSPFLTPNPYRGTICEPKHVRVTAEFLANLRSESLDEIASATTRNARRLFEF